MIDYNVYPILPSECLGDALAKINSNFLLFDVLACNANNTFNLIKNNVKDLQAASIEIENAFEYVLSKCQIFNTAYQITSELYKYWIDQQVTVYIPQHYIAPNIANAAEIARVGYINKNYNPTNYSSYTILNAVKTNFNRAPWQAAAPSFKTADSFIQVKEISHSIYRYINLNGRWNYFETIFCPSAAQPDILDEPSVCTKLILSAYNFRTFENLTLIDASAMLSTVAGVTAFAADDYISWEWNINNVSTTLPVSGESQTNKLINIENINTIADAAAITLSIEQGRFSDVATLSTLNLIAYNYRDTGMRIAETSLTLYDMPSRDLLDVYFTISENNVLVGDSNLTTLTRPNLYNTFRFDSYVKTKPTTNKYKTQWIVNTPTKHNIISSDILNINLREKGLTTITLCAYDVFSSGWAREWDISRTIKIYQLDASQINPTFFVFPTRAWNGPTQQFIDINSTNYLTHSTAPTAYAYKSNLTESFNVSATSGYDQYVWSVGNTMLSTASNTAVLDILYSDGLYLSEGATISLTAYNTYYPASNNSITYITSTGTYTYPITSATDNNSSNAFRRSPKIVSHNDAFFQFALNEYEFDISTNNQIIAYQEINVKSATLPTKIVGGSVKYSLYTCDWMSDTVVDINENPVNLFCLREGDSKSVLTVDATNITNLKLSAVATLLLHIDDPVHSRDIVETVLSYAPDII